MQFFIVKEMIVCFVMLWTSVRSADPLGPPVDVVCKTLNCTAISVRWWIAWKHTHSITGYRVTCTELTGGLPKEDPVVLNIPISLDIVTEVQMHGRAHFNAVVGNLKTATEYSVCVQAFGWTGVGRPSRTQTVRTRSDDGRRQPATPTHLRVAAVSDTEIVLSWQPGREDDSSNVHHFLVSYMRTELDSVWSTVQVSGQTNSSILTGLSPHTRYSLELRAVSGCGTTSLSSGSDPVWTFSAPYEGGGHLERMQKLTDSQLNDEDRRTDDDDGLSEELTPSPHVTSLRSITARPESRSRKELISFRLNRNDPSIAKHVAEASSSVSGPSDLATSPPAAPRGPVMRWRGTGRQLYDLLCEDAVCPPDSVCVNDYSSGGSRCHCALGRQGDTCLDTVDVKFPKLFGYSHLAFEPLKNSFLTFEITLEFKAEAEDGLLLYCGEDERGEGDFASLALVRGKLHFRYNCGTGAAHIISNGRVNVGRWHRVTLRRDGLNGWLRLDNNTPVSGHAQGLYTKITFRTPLYVGGSPAVYWLAKAAGTNRGFHGCIQSLSVNGQVIDMRPWPRGRALTGADVGECSDGVCAGVICENGGVCYASQADQSICLCPFGFTGPFCQDRSLPIIPFFSAALRSYMSVPWPLSSRHYLSFMEFEITFLPTAPDGTLVYSEDTDSKDFLSVTLRDGHVEFRFDCGTGPAVLRSAEGVHMFTWHDLRLTRSSRGGTLELDEQMVTLGSSEGAFTQVRCNTPLYFGGVPNYEQTKSSAAVQVPFTGSIQQVRVNSVDLRLSEGSVTWVNVQESRHACVKNPCLNRGFCRPKHEHYKCECPLGYEDNHCQRAVDGSVEVPRFTGRSYLMFDSPDLLKRLSGSRTHISMRFRSSAPDGLLLWRGDGPSHPNSDFIFLGLQDGSVVLKFNLGSGSATIIINGTFSDGKWHRIKATRIGRVGRLRADQSDVSVGKSAGKMRQLNTRGPLYIGGVRESSAHQQKVRGLIGCISHLTLSSDVHISLVEEATQIKNIHSCLH